MPDEVVKKVSIVVRLEADVEQGDAEVKAALKSVGDAAAVTAEKAGRLAVATRAARVAASEVAAAEKAVGKAEKGGDPAKVSAAYGTLESSRAQAEQARAAELAARESLAVAREAEATARGSLSSAERQAAAAGAALAKEQAAAAQTAAALAEVNRERSTEEAVVGRLLTREQELVAKREAVGAEGKGAIDQELAGIRKTIGGRQDEIAKLEVKRLHLEEAGRVALAASEAEVKAIRAETDARVVDVHATRDQQRAVAAVREEAAKTKGGEGGGLLQRVLGVAAGLELKDAFDHVREAIGKATEAARDAEQTQLRFQAALGGSAAKLREMNALADEIQDASVYDGGDLAKVGTMLLESGVKAGQLDKAIRAVANTASALHRPLQDVAADVAATFKGDAPDRLRNVVRGMENLSEESLRAGAAVDVLTRAYDGQAAAQARTADGREEIRARNLASAWENAGKAILPLERAIRSKLTDALKEAAKAAELLGAGLSQAVAHQHSLEGLGLSLAGGFASMLPGQTAAAFSQATESLTSQINVSDAHGEMADRSDQLAKDGENATAEAKASLAEVARLRDEFDHDRSAKHLAEVQQSVEAEFKVRVKGVQDLLSAIDAVTAARRDPLAGSLASLVAEQDEARRTADEQLARANSARAASLKAQAEGDKSIGQAKADETNVALRAQAESLRTVAELEERILGLRKQIGDVDRQGNVDRAKAIDEAIKQVQADEASAKQRFTDKLAVTDTKGEVGGDRPVRGRA